MTKELDHKNILINFDNDLIHIRDQIRDLLEEVNDMHLTYRGCIEELDDE